MVLGEHVTPVELRKKIWDAQKTSLAVVTKPCCVKYLVNVFGTSKTFLYRTPVPSSGREQPVLTDVMAWFYVIQEIADAVPNAEKTPKFQLSAPTRASVYEWYKKDVETWPDVYHKCSHPYFNQIWRTKFASIILRRHLLFTKCSFCVNKRAIKWDRTKTVEERDAAVADLVKHYEWIVAERAGERQRAIYSVQNPDKRLVIAQDATSMLTFGYPAFAECTKEDTAYRLKPHLMVDVVYGEGVWVYDSLQHIYGDPNFTIECLQRTLKHVETVRGVLPPALDIHLDNSTRENKNNAVFDWAAWLVERGAFKEIRISFLPVGHTHNLPDQVNSRLSIACRFREIRTRAELISVLQNCYQPKPNCEHVDHVADIKQLMKKNSKAIRS
jgi:hypothetical protein